MWVFIILIIHTTDVLTQVLLNQVHVCPVYANIVDPDQLASTRSALFVIKYENVCQQPESNNLIG